MHKWFSEWKKWLVHGLLVCGAAPMVHAFTLSNGETVQCEVSLNGRAGVATEIWVNYTDIKDRHPELGRAVAVMRPDAQGWPTIILDAEAFKRTGKGTPAIWDFVYFHECAHAQQPQLGEIGANCAAYVDMERRGLMSYHRYKEIEAVHLSMMSLPMEYGGSGPQFWHQTLQCAKKGKE
ncbi:MAG: hypothetical protein RL700_144 [Pseudomonadota bacterium]